MAKGNQIKANERAMFCGKTGSGKSFALATVAAMFANVGILDTKGMFNWEKEVPGVGEIPVIKRFDKLKHVGMGKFIYRPVDAENTPDYHEGFLRWIYNRTNTIAAIDEVMQITYRNEAPPALHDILQRGRQKNVGCFMATQRPTWIPMGCISESDHFFIFELTYGPDRKKMAEFAGDEVLELPPAEYPHGFWYYGTKLRRPVFVEDINILRRR